MVNSLKTLPEQGLLQNHCQTLTLQRTRFQRSAELCLAMASLSTLQEEATHFLHSEELEYLAALPFAKRQHSYLLGRYAAKQAIIQYDQTLTPTAVNIRSGIFENPIAYHPTPQKIQISLSHSEPLGAALAFPEEHPMGIDIECISSQHSCIETQLTATEKQWIKQCSHTPLFVLHTLFWTAKEALSKVLRTGMMSPFEIYALKNLTCHGHYWTNEFENFAQYQALLFLLDNYICAIVYPKQTTLTIDVKAAQQWIRNLNIIDLKSVNLKHTPALASYHLGSK